MCRWEHLSLKRKSCSMESLNPRRSLSIGLGDSSPRDPPNREESIEDGECGGYGSIPTLLPPKACTRRARDRKRSRWRVASCNWLLDVQPSPTFHIG